MFSKKMNYATYEILSEGKKMKITEKALTELREH